MNFKNIIIGIILVGLFFVLIMSFGIQLSNENGTNVTIMQNPSLNKALGNISSQLNSTLSTSESQRQGFTEESANPVITALGFIFRSILSALLVFMGVGINMFNIFFGMVVGVLNVNPIVTGTLLGILIISLVLAAWRLVRAGE